MRRFKAAVVQAGSVAFNPQGSVDKAVRLMAEAAAAGARLAVFPEAFISVYPKGSDFGARVGMRMPEGREAFRRYYDSAIDVPGPETAALGVAAAKTGLHIVIGVIERDGGTLYCTALLIGPDGALMGKHRKLMPTAMERLIWGYGDGSTLPVLDTPIGRIGSVICWENYMPLLRMAMYAQGVQLYCAPTADDRETWLPTLRHIAFEGRCFVLSSCQFIRRGDYPEDYAAVQGNDPTAVIMRGGSCIIGPLGQVLAGPNFEGECILTADIDLEEIVRAKYDFDVSGHYARPDIFSLHVNAAPMPAVTWRGRDRERADMPLQISPAYAAESAGAPDSGWRPDHFTAGEVRR